MGLLLLFSLFSRILQMKMIKKPIGFLLGYNRVKKIVWQSVIIAEQKTLQKEWMKTHF